MTHKGFLYYVLIFLLSLILAACSNDANEANNKNNEEQVEQTEDEEINGDLDDDEDLNDEDTNEGDSNEEPVEAVSPSEVEDSISFTRVNWMMGAPDRKPNPGVWLYTEDDHPSNKADVFNFDEYDILLYQVGNEEFLGYVFRAQRIVLEENDVVRVIVREHSEPDENANVEDLKMPRQYLQVEKGVLRGKSFIFETEDGKPLSVQ